MSCLASQHARMRYAYIALAAVLLAGNLTATIIMWRRQQRLRRAVAQAILDDAASERRIRELVGAEELHDAVNGGNGRRHLRLLPAVTPIAAMVWGWIKSHPGLIGGMMAGLAVAVLLVVAGSTSVNDKVMATPSTPDITTTGRWPSSASEAPPLATTVPRTTQPTATSTPALTESMTPQAAPPLPTSTTTVTEDDHGKHDHRASISKTKVTGSQTTTCLLRLDLLLGVCVD